MNLGELRAFVRKQTLVSADAVDNATLNGFINEGLLALAARFNWPFLEEKATFTAVADQENYPLPADYRRTRVIVPVAQGRRLERVSLEGVMRQYGASLPAAAVADRFYIYGEELHLVPTPDISGTEYQHFYSRNITLLSSDTAEPEFVRDFHIAPARHAIARVWEYEEDYPKVREADQRFDTDVEMMARYYLSRAEEYPSIYGESRNRAVVDNMPFLSGV